MRKLWVLGLVSLFFAGSLLAQEKPRTVKLKGQISGVLCAAHGMLCPKDPEHAKKAELLGVFTQDKTFYYLANVPYRLLELNALKEVEVEGEPLPGYSSLIVKTLKIGKRTVFQEGYLIDPMGHKVLPGEAHEVEGEFYCAECTRAKAAKEVGVTLRVEGMTCTGCEANIEKAVRNLSGVKQVKADYKKGEVKVTFEKGKVSVEKIQEAIHKAGYKVPK